MSAYSTHAVTAFGPLPGSAPAFAAAIATLLLSYFGFRWLLIRYHEWQIGHKNPFTIWADMRAFASLVLFV